MATSTTSISGLVSGLDTSTIISQLMQIEAQPQTDLKTRMSTEQSNVSTLQALNAQFASLATKAQALSTATSWSPLTTSSSSDSVVATAGPTAVAGTLSFTVLSTASATQQSFATSAPLSGVVTSGSTSLTLTKHDGTTVPIDTGNGTLSGLVSAVNKANAGVTASAVKLDDGTYRLRLVSTSTGADSDFTLTNTDGSAILGGATTTAGQDAAISLGSDTLHSASNTFSSLTTGLDVTIGAGTPSGTAVTITTTRDASSAQAAAKDLVDSANAILTQIDSLTAYNATTKTSGALAGDATVRELRSRLLDTVTRAADGSSMAGVGIQTDRDGKIVFDATKFASAYAADPGTVAAKLGAPGTGSVPGFAARLYVAANSASDATKGVLTTDITGRQSSVTTMQNSIDDWDVKLAAKQDSLQKVYTNLEVALGKLQNQSSWLAGQLNSLSSSSSSSS
jgi:flagellar hook-associated protein 2